MKSQKIGTSSDRYLPTRKGISVDHLTISPYSKPPVKDYPFTLAKNILSDKKRCLSFTNKQSNNDTTQIFKSLNKYPLYSQTTKRQKPKAIHIKPQKILQTPGVINNFYYNLLDWSSKGIISVAVGNKWYLKDQQDRIQFIQWFQFQNDKHISSIKFNQQGSLLYTGNQDGQINVIDLERMNIVRNFTNHYQRIGCIANYQPWGFLTGSKDQAIVLNDLRKPDPIALKLLAHRQQVCGISVKKNLVASGGNDGHIFLWDVRNKNSISQKIYHKGAVKALQWCPWKSNLLASGGGSKDKQIIFYNTEIQEIQKKIQCKSQITGLTWRNTYKDIVSVHGGSINKSQGIVWDFVNKKPKIILSGHEARILGVSVCQENENKIWTISADEKMYYWNLGQSKKKNIGEKQIRSSFSTFSLK